MPVSPLMRSWIDLPPVPVRQGGVLDIATVIDVQGHQLLGVEGESDACLGPTKVWLGDICTTAGLTKSFDNAANFVSGNPFTLYAAAECDLGLEPIEVTKTTARRRFDYGERKGVDAGVRSALAALATDLGGAATVSLLEAIALAEQYLAVNYGGIGTIVAQTKATAYACGRRYIEAGLSGPATCLGTLWGTQSSLTDADRIYVFGHLFLLRGPVIEIDVPPLVNPDGTWLPARALVERTYVPVIDCGVGFQRFSLTACDCGAPATQQSEPVTEPPELSYLSHTEVSVTDPPFGLHAHGENFTDDADIVVNGTHMPTAFVDDHEIVTVINPAAWNPGDVASITVVTPHGTSSALSLSFTA